MSGLVERLSDAASIADQWGDPDVRDLLKEAAVEVERLRAQLAGANSGRAILHASVEGLRSDNQRLRSKLIAMCARFTSNDVAQVVAGCERSVAKLRPISTEQDAWWPLYASLDRVRGMIAEADRVMGEFNPNA